MKRTVLMLVLLCSVFIVKANSLFLPVADESSYVSNLHYQTQEEIIARVNSANVGDILSKADANLLATVPMAQPAQFVQAYLELDPTYIQEVADYFQVELIAS